MKITSITVGDFIDNDEAERLVQFLVTGMYASKVVIGEEDKADEAEQTAPSGEKGDVSGGAGELPSVDGAPKPRRRRSASKPAKDKEADAGGASDTKAKDTPKPRRRRRSEAKAEELEKEVGPAPEGTADITDEELTKSASAAARKITPKGVKDILAEFGAEAVGDLPQDVRQEFLDRLKAGE